MENVQPPTLPPMALKDHQESRGQHPPRNLPQERGHELPPGPSGHAKPEWRDSGEARRTSGNVSPGGRQGTRDDPPSPGGVAHRGAQRPQELSHDQPQPSGLSPQQPPTRSGGDNSQHDPAKSINSRIIQEHLEDDGNEADISCLSGVGPYPIQRPTALGQDNPPRSKARSTRPMARTSSLGDTQTGNLVSHPSSEPSDVESLLGSAVGLQEVSGETTDPSWGHQASAAEETTATDVATPVSVDSPSDISVISQSPENTNSATYDFISIPGEDESPSADGPNRDKFDHDDEDEFEILMKESQHAESTPES